jgi:uncharacterized membrane protein YfcA
VLTKIYAISRHYRQNTINLRVGLRFLIPALPGVICTSMLVAWGTATLSPTQVDALQNTITYVIILSMGVSMVVLLSDFSRFQNRMSCSPFARPLRALCVFLLGAIVGATSIGGGILMIPALIFLYRETTRYVGTSIFVAVLLMLVMSAIYALFGEADDSGVVNWRVAGFMALGSLAGTHYGSGLSKRVDARLLRLIVGGVVLLAVIMMFANMAR